MTDIAEILRKAELQHRQLELEVRFKKNMAIFAKAAPAIHQRFLNYQPEELKLSFDENNEVSLVNFKLDNKPVYGGQSPKDICTAQVKNFVDQPTTASITLEPTPDDTRRFRQVSMLNELLEQSDRSIKNPNINCSAPIGMMLVTGCGLGYHIEQLLAQLDIFSMCIVDPHSDSFYASLHTIDWTPIIHHFVPAGRNLKLYIGTTPDVAMLGLRSLADDIGLFNISTAFVFRHFNSKEEEAFLELYKKEFHLAAMGLGFLEDEQISLSHSLNNLRDQVPILNDKQVADLPTAIVVGNGPSLDGLLEPLRSMRSKVIIFSCGSATGSLCKAGIKPDYHIEMERTRGTFDWIKKSTTEEFRKGIRLLALNTVTPETFSLFDHKYMATKPNDLGASLIHVLFDKKAPDLDACNPTVTNCGLSYALRLGFKDIYLFGVDLGMIDEDSHHSKGSFYYELSDEKQEFIAQNIFKNSNYQRPGNFRELVTTTSTLDTSRANIELLLSLQKHDFNVHNVNDGVRINGTICTKPEDINIQGTDIDREKVLGKIANRCFSTPKQNAGITEEQINTRYLADFFVLTKALKLPDNLKDKTEIHEALCVRFAHIVEIEKKNPVAGQLLRGSTNAFFTLLARSTLFNDTDIEHSYELGKNSFNEFMDYSDELIRTKLMALDHSHIVW
jgi:hypothetical protein